MDVHKLLAENRKNYIYLFVSYGISLFFIGASYLVYSHLLSPGEFGLYAIALAMGSIGTLILDGGLKVAVIKHFQDFSEREKGVLLSWLTIISIALSLILVFAEKPLVYFKPIIQNDYRFISVFSIIYLLSYPFVSIPTAFLERGLNYKRLSIIESACNIVERASPALFLLYANFGINSFIWGLALGRILRITSLYVSHPVIFCALKIDRIKPLIPLWKEGIWIQTASGLSLLRDNLHILIIGPLFGKDWVGFYSWGLQLCILLSQAFVQVSARISLPLMAQSEDFDSRWTICLKQIRYLTIFTCPLLIVSLVLIPGINDAFFNSKWTPALGILPFLFLRMVVGLSTTPIGNLIPVQKGAYVYARANGIWTLMEIASSLVFIFILGSIGLAYSYAVMVWAGLFVFLRSLEGNYKNLFIDIANETFFRPSIFISGLFCIFLHYYFSYNGIMVVNALKIAIPYSLATIIISYLSERDIRSAILPLLNQPTG